jgi:hypothetical protein
MFYVMFPAKPTYNWGAQYAAGMIIFLMCKWIINSTFVERKDC